MSTESLLDEFPMTLEGGCDSTCEIFPKNAFDEALMFQIALTRGFHLIELARQCAVEARASV